MPPIEPTVMLELVKALGPLGFILWLAHRIATHTFPRLAEENNRAQKELREDFRDMMAVQNQFFQNQIERERQVYTQSLQQVIDALRDKR